MEETAVRFLSLFVSLLFLAGVAHADDHSASAKAVSFTTSDKVILKGSYFPGKPGAPIVLLLHQLGSDRSEFVGLAKLLQGKGFNVLAYDARGHGESVVRDGKKTSYEDFVREDFEKMTLDIEAALAHLRQDKRLAKAPVGIVGASIQSSTGLIFASKHPEVKALVMLSPGLDYRGIDTVAPMKIYGARPVFLAAGIQDAASYKAVRELEAVSAGPKKKAVFSNSAHGTAMLREEPGFEKKTADWISANLK